MFSKSKVSQSMIDAVNSVLGEKSEEKIIKNVLLDEATEKVPTPTGMKVYGSNYGNSMKARKDQTSHEIDKVKGPKDKEMKEAAKPDFLDMDKDGNKKESMKKALADKAMKEELKGNQDRIDANHNNKIDGQDFKILRGKKKVKEGREFTEKLLETVRKSDVPAYLRKAKGDTPLTMADVKAPKKDSISAPENLAKARNEEYDKNKEFEQVEHLDETPGAQAMKASGVKQSPDKLLARTGMNMAHKFPRKGQTNLGNIPAMNTPGNSPETDAYAEKRRGDRAKELKPAIKSALGTHGPKGKLPEEVELTEEQLDEMINEVLGKDATAGDWIHDFVHSDNPKFAGKSKAERKKMALGAYYGKQNEETNDDASVTTDTLAGRLPGGKSNSFKSYKIGVKPLDKEGDAATKAPDMKKPVVTPAMKSHEVKEETVEEKVIAGTPGWEKIPKNVKDKSGAVHTPMSRAKDLARQSFKKLKNEMLGKAPGNN